MVRKGRWDHLRCIKVPDVCPMDALNPDAQLSMAAGAAWHLARTSQSLLEEFVEVYKTQARAAQSFKRTWDLGICLGWHGHMLLS